MFLRRIVEDNINSRLVLWNFSFMNFTWCNLEKKKNLQKLLVNWPKWLEYFHQNFPYKQFSYDYDIYNSFIIS